MYLPYRAGVHECSGIELYIVGLSDSGNFLITIVRTLLFMIMNSIMIVGLLVYLFINTMIKTEQRNIFVKVLSTDLMLYNNSIS